LDWLDYICLVSEAALPELSPVVRARFVAIAKALDIYAPRILKVLSLKEFAVLLGDVAYAALIGEEADPQAEADAVAAIVRKAEAEGDDGKAEAKLRRDARRRGLRAIKSRGNGLWYFANDANFQVSPESGLTFDEAVEFLEQK
jgi:hypothetical protein